jgi:NADPH:quinone reductase-like Zn-dependent oxidoreductase
VPARVPDGGLDVVFESIGGAGALRLLDILTPATGRMVYYGTLRRLEQRSAIGKRVLVP